MQDIAKIGFFVCLGNCCPGDDGDQYAFSVKVKPEKP